MPNELPMHTIRVGGRTPDAFTAPAGNDAETDSKAGKAKVAKEDFKKTRLFISVSRGNQLGINQRSPFHLLYIP